RVFHRALDMARRGGDAAKWDAVLADADGAAMRPIEQLEILYLRAASELGAGQGEAARVTVDRAQSYVDRFPAWRARFAELAAGTPAWVSTQQQPPGPGRNRSMSAS
ncbi:MAG TPA: hypothetical protein VNO33_02085, partial [Kofleriaceae bacterium]|nr:hypothetical protein [Kofleriaceae bacterium]